MLQQMSQTGRPSGFLIELLLFFSNYPFPPISILPAEAFSRGKDIL